MTFPPPNPYDPNQSPGHSQPPQQPSFGQPSQPGYGVPPQPGGYSAPQPPPGGGYSVPPQQPGYPPQPGGPYGAPPPPMPPASGGGGGLLVKILSGAGVLVVGLVIVIIRAMNNDDSGSDFNAAEDTATEAATLSEEEVEAAEAAAIGDCMSDAAESANADLVVPCDDATAFWTITQVSDDSGATVSIMGGLDDPSIAGSVCGEEYMTWTPGELWKSYQYVYTETIEGAGGPVDYLYCVEAIDKEDADGGRPITPNTGDCTADGVRTFDCSNAAALYVIDAIEVYDPPVDQLSFDHTTALGGCSGSDYYATPVTGGDEILPVVYFAYCSSDNA
jgi:hypothetical protein